MKKRDRNKKDSSEVYQFLETKKLLGDKVSVWQDKGHKNNVITIRREEKRYSITVDSTLPVDEVWKEVCFEINKADESDVI